MKLNGIILKKLMINTILYYPFISVCAESIPQYKLKVRSAILSPYRAEFSAIISHKTYNMDNYFTEICVSPRKYFTCLIYFALYTWIPLFVQCFIFTLYQKVFNQKIQDYNLTNFYNKNKLTIIYNYAKENVWNCKLFIINYVKVI